MMIPKNQFGCFEPDALGTIFPGKLLQDQYIQIFFFPTLYYFSLQQFTTVYGAQRVQFETPKLIFHYLHFIYFFAFTPLFLKGLKIHLLILFLTFYFQLKNIRDNNIIIEEYIKIMNKSKGKRKKVKCCKQKNNEVIKYSYQIMLIKRIT